MAGEHVHTISKERRVPELMLSSKLVLQLSITGSKVKWSLCFASAMFSPLHNATGEGEALCNQSSHHKNMDDSFVPNINY